MPDAVISDASCIIILDKIDELSILKSLYSNFFITIDIANECQIKLPNWITVRAYSDDKYFDFLNTFLDAGESSAIALYMEMNNPLLIIDDLKARKYANRMNLNITGTLGIINKAKREGVIKEIQPILEKISRSDFRISEKVVYELLKLNNEI